MENGKNSFIGTFLILVMLSILFLFIFGYNLDKKSSDIWDKNCIFLENNRNNITNDIAVILDKDINYENKKNQIKDILTLRYNNNSLKIYNMNIFIEDIPNDKYIVSSSFKIKHCRNKEELKFIIKKGEFKK